MSDKTILVIDDSATIRKLVDNHLSPCGYQVVLAPNAEIGLELAAEIHPDLILLDHQLPGTTGFEVSVGFDSNGYGAHSPGGYSLLAAMVTEVVMTMMFLFVILGVTDDRAPKGFAPLPIGLCLTLIHLISIPVTNTSVNPARSTGVAIFVGDWAVAQLWLFWLAPIGGAIIGALIYRYIGRGKEYGGVEL